MGQKFPRKTIFTGIVLVALLALGIGILTFPAPDISPGKAAVTVRDVEYRVEVADTANERTQGLQNRTQLGENEGMLFVFDEPGKYDFWNKATPLALDLILIRNGVIVERGFLPPYDPDSEPAHYYPNVAAEFVLEVNKGQIPKHQFKVGDEVQIKFL